MERGQARLFSNSIEPCTLLEMTHALVGPDEQGRAGVYWSATTLAGSAQDAWQADSPLAPSPSPIRALRTISTSGVCAADQEVILSDCVIGVIRSFGGCR